MNYNSLQLFLILFFATPAFANIDNHVTNYHLVGWSNAFVPGSGQAWLGNVGTGLGQATYEIGSFWLGYYWARGSEFSLDGFASPRPAARVGRVKQINTDQALAGDLLQEFGTKSHMVNTFNAYREAAFAYGEHPEIESKSTLDLFQEPFLEKNLKNPWVMIPLGIVFTTAVVDYISQVSGTITTTHRLDPSSNALYAFNYGLWQPFGSGAPEEMFYRGFLQNEFKDLTDSSFASIAMSTTLFALSHVPGDGRISAAVAGSYLGFLADKYHGKLGPGITVHFWSSIILGLETILLNSKGQRTTPPTGMSVQVNF